MSDWRGWARWRVGRRVGRTIYAMHGERPHDADELIGVLDTPELARAAVRAHNAELDTDPGPRGQR